jgi:hypothetical protein
MIQNKVKPSPIIFLILHDTNESTDPNTSPTIFAKASALDESHLSHHLGTKDLGVHLKGAHL